MLILSILKHETSKKYQENIEDEFCSLWKSITNYKIFFFFCVSLIRGNGFRMIASCQKGNTERWIAKYLSNNKKSKFIKFGFCTCKWPSIDFQDLRESYLNSNTIYRNSGDVLQMRNECSNLFHVVFVFAPILKGLFLCSIGNIPRYPV